MFTPKKGQATPRNSPLLSASGRRKRPLITTAGLAGSTNVSGDSSSQVIESYGCPLPVKVAELISSSRGFQCSVRICENGWAWLVTGQKAAIWRYEPSRSGKPGVCRVLPLPPSAVGNTSEMMCVISSEAGTKAYMATADGIVRYWSNILQEYNYIESSVSLSDQILVEMHYIQQNTGVVIAANDGSLFCLQVSKAGLVCAALLNSAGMMSAVGRRVSSFIFGGAAANSDSTKTSLRAVACTNSLNEEFIYVLCEKELQKIHYNNRAKIYSIDMRQIVLDASFKLGISTNLLLLLNIKCTKSGVIILLSYQQDASLLKFGFAHLNTNSLIAPTHLTSFVPTKLVIEKPDRPDCLSVSLNYPDSVYQTAYIGIGESVFAVSTADQSCQVNKMDFTGTAEKILGMGYHCTSQGAVVLAFGKQRGLMAIRSAIAADTRIGTFLNDSVALNESANQSRVDMDVSALTESGTPSNVLKAAFLVWLTDGQPQGSYVLDQIKVSLDNLDYQVVELSEKILNDFPANDPRWAESKVTQDFAPLALSVLIFNQLQEKLKIHRLFVTFLTSTGLTNKLRSYKSKSTMQILYERTELIVAAKTIREIQNESPLVVEAAIARCLKKRECAGSVNLTPSDLFYREVLCIGVFLSELIQFEEAEIGLLTASNDIVALISNVNIICISIVMEVTKYREAAYISNLFVRDPHHTVWTKTDDTRQIIIKQCAMTQQYALPHCETAQDSSMLSQQLADMVDIVCDSFVAVIQAAQPNAGDLEAKYKQTRHTLLQPFIDNEQFERAAELAEKYMDFGILIQLCEKTGNEKRLHSYQEKYADHGFNELLFDYYIREGKQSKLLSQPAIAISEVENYLHEGDNLDLKWLHDVKHGEFVDAHKTLAQMAIRETDSLEKKKTLFSLSKLAALASDDMDELTPNIKIIDNQQILIKHQETLPEDIIKGFGMDAGDMRVFSSTELIEAYIGDCNPNATELDFKRALDLLSFCDEEAVPDLASLKMHIWCRAVLRDDWLYASGNPLSDCREKVVFKLVELLAADLEGEELLSAIPKLDALLASSELAEITKNSTCEYLLRAGYEHLHTTEVV